MIRVEIILSSLLFPIREDKVVIVPFFYTLRMLQFSFVLLFVNIVYWVSVVSYTNRVILHDMEITTPRKVVIFSTIFDKRVGNFSIQVLITYPDINVGRIFWFWLNCHRFLLAYFCLTNVFWGNWKCGNYVNWVNSTDVCAKIVFRSGKFQNALTGTNPPSCSVINHGLGRVRKIRRKEELWWQDCHIRLIALRD